MPAEVAQKDEWLWRIEVARRFGTSPLAAERIARAAGVRMLQMPGMTAPKYHAEDVDRVYRESISVPGTKPPPRAAKRRPSTQRA